MTNEKSMQRQIEGIKKVMKANGIVEEKSKTHTDKGYLGSDEYRPGLLKMFDTVTEGEVLEVVVKNIDILANDPDEAKQLSKGLENRGAEIYECSEEKYQKSSVTLEELEEIIK